MHLLQDTDLATSDFRLAFIGGAFHVYMHHEVEVTSAGHGATTITVGRLAPSGMRRINHGRKVVGVQQWGSCIVKLFLSVLSLNGLLIFFC